MIITIRYTIEITPFSSVDPQISHDTPSAKAEAFFTG